MLEIYFTKKHFFKWWTKRAKYVLVKQNMLYIHIVHSVELSSAKVLWTKYISSAWFQPNHAPESLPRFKNATFQRFKIMKSYSNMEIMAMIERACVVTRARGRDNSHALPHKECGAKKIAWWRYEVHDLYEVRYRSSWSWFRLKITPKQKFDRLSSQKIEKLKTLIRLT